MYCGFETIREARSLADRHSNVQPRSVTWSGSLGFLEVFPVDTAGNADISRRMLMQDDVDDLWVRSDRVVGDLNDVTDQLFPTLRRQAGLDMAFDERHGMSPAISI
jgi:hypothetical protein